MTFVPRRDDGDVAQREPSIGVIGTGYVGLVVGTCLAEAGHRVTCVDISEERVALLQQGRVPFFEPGLEGLLRSALQAERILFTTELSKAAAEANVVFLTVGTPSNPDDSPDLSAVFDGAEALARAAPGPRTLVIKSTVPVGTTARVQALVDGVARHPIEVLMNPEFLREGTAIKDFQEPTRVVVGARCEEEARPLTALYRALIPGSALLVVDPSSAELAKYATNAFLATKVSFINEIAGLCEKAGADAELVRMVAGLDPRVGSSYMAPGLGYGGSCLPKDLRGLEAMAREHRVPLRILPSVREVNRAQPERIAQRIAEHFDGPLRGRHLAVWGLAFKPETDDVRESPAIALIRLLVQRGAHVTAYDPEAMDTARTVLGEAVTYAKDMYAALTDADALIVATEWREFREADLERVKTLLASPVVFDARNVFNRQLMVSHGITGYSVGYAGSPGAVDGHASLAVSRYLQPVSPPLSEPVRPASFPHVIGGHSPMKLVVTIPAYNEEDTIGEVVRSIPRSLDGIDEVRVLVVNDGSTDRTVERAQAAGADRVVSFRGRRGLAAVFKGGLDNALAMGADVIVNIDADGQYDPDEMPKLLQPVLEGEADMVLGSRLAGTIEYMPWQKRLGNRIGSRVVAKMAGLPVTDTQTGYRAFTRDAARSMNIIAGYTYTQETVFQAANSKLKVVDVPVTFRRRTSGNSRLMSGVINYIARAGSAIVRSFLGYHALRVLALCGILPVLAGMGLGARVLLHYATTGAVTPMVPSAMAAGYLILFGFQLLVMGVLAGLVVSNRRLLEDVLFRMKDRREVESWLPSQPKVPTQSAAERHANGSKTPVGVYERQTA